MRFFHKFDYRQGMPLASAMVLIAFALVFTACDDDDHDHDPAAGKGAILVDNNTINSIVLFVDGISLGKIDEGDDKAFDVDPGIRRVILEESSGDRSFRTDLDIVEGLTTVMDVAGRAGNADRYDVLIYFD